MDQRQFSPSVMRNKDAILSVLRDEIPSVGRFLEVASGSGEHVVHFAKALPNTNWQPTDVSNEALLSIDAHVAAAGLKNIESAKLLDVVNHPWQLGGDDIDPLDGIFCANMIHIAPWEAAVGLITGAASMLVPGAPLVLYGPFSRDGNFGAESNLAFDESLRSRDPRWGIRDLIRDIQPLANEAGLRLAAVHEMPANNLAVVFR